MLTLFYYLAFIDNQDGVSFADGREAVGYNKGGAVFHQFIQRLFYQSFAFAVKGGGGFVQY
jgi:hypothetical protein